MALKIANIDINKGYLGDLELSVAYLGAIEASFIKSDFIISVKTDNPGSSSDNEFTLPWIGTYDIDWGDGTKEKNVTDYQTHTYNTSGTYEVKVKAIAGRISFANSVDKSKVIDIKNWGTCAWTSMSSAFYGCNSLTVVSASDTPNLSSVSSFYFAFSQCSSLTSMDVSNWDVSNVSTMEFAFRSSPITTLDVSNWNTQSLTNAAYIFQNAIFNPDVSNWNMSNVTTIRYMLRNADSFDRSLANWDISNITNMSDLLILATGLSTANYDATLISWAAQSPQINQSISFGNSQYTYEGAAARQTLIDTYGWTITDGGQAVSPEFALKWETTTPNEEIQVGVGDGTFDYVIDWGDGTVESYNTDANISHTYADAGFYVTKITGDFPHIKMGQGSISLTFKYKLKDILNWGSQTWESLQEGFKDCDRLTVITAGDTPDLSNVTSISNVLANLNNYVSFDSLSNWNVSNVSNFSSALSLGYNHSVPDISNWDFSNATNLSGFVKGTDFNQDVSSWNVSNVTKMEEMFRGTSFNQDVSFWNVSGVTNMFYMFKDTPFNQDISSWNVSSVTSLYGMFQGTPFNQDISGWDVSGVQIFNFMFLNATAFNQPIGLWNTSNLQGANQFLYGATSFDQSLANWDITNIPDNPRSFQGLPNFLTNITISTANYDATLISWSQQQTGLNVNANFGNSQYTLGGAAEAARNTLINTYGWTITDGGGI